MTPELRAIVEEGYEVFAGYRVRQSLSVCRCICCMTAEDEQLLLKMPLRDIPSPILSAYTNSAHAWDDGPVAQDMRYFLPRYLELIAEDNPPDHLGLDACLRRLADADWREKWPDAEVRLLDRFFEALTVAGTVKLDLVHRPAGWKLAFDLADVLTCVVTAKGDLGRVLAALDRLDDPPAAIHMAALRQRVVITTECASLYSAHLEGDHGAEAEAIGTFLMRPEVGRRIEAAFFHVEDPGLQQILSDALLI